MLKHMYDGILLLLMLAVIYWFCWFCCTYFLERHWKRMEELGKHPPLDKNDMTAYVEIEGITEWREYVEIETATVWTERLTLWDRLMIGKFTRDNVEQWILKRYQWQIDLHDFHAVCGKVEIPWAT